MPTIPFIGRLALQQYAALLGSLVLILLESIVRIITLALPGPVIRFFYEGSRSAFNYLSSPQGRRNRGKRKLIVNSINQASDFVELCEIYGYSAEEHIVHTADGYLLGLHRLGWRKGEEDQRVNNGPGSLQKKVVYMHHGLMMNSEVWVCITEKERCLPFMLVEMGYDVWFGNNRGNKYSKKSARNAPTDTRFWNFSIDEFAFHDIPDSISYILSTTHQPSLSYVGFSQGTAQAFATLSIHPTLNQRVDVFIALAPAMAPAGLTSSVVDSLVRTSPDVLFLAFGRRAILSSTTMWQAILYPPIFVRFIDMGLSFLFGWHARNISPHQKLAAYPHLYSFTSTKSVVHWFQIIRNGTFQMYDDEVQGPLSFSNGSKYYKVAKFPTRNIRTPIVLVYGGSDSLVDINVMLKELPKHTIAKEIPHYEHLDFLWAADVNSQVFPHVIDALNDFAAPSNRKPDFTTTLHTTTATSRAFNPLISPQPPSYSEDERSPHPSTAPTSATNAHSPSPTHLDPSTTPPPSSSTSHRHNGTPTGRLRATIVRSDSLSDISTGSKKTRRPGNRKFTVSTTMTTQDEASGNSSVPDEREVEEEEKDSQSSCATTPTLMGAAGETTFSENGAKAGVESATQGVMSRELEGVGGG
ncbi:MAG: cholesterol esterase [Bathelium mastoideum]|nr:MAG: cholesterol esterase [Bathelium mastoideum]